MAGYVPRIEGNLETGKRRVSFFFFASIIDKRVGSVLRNT